MNKDKTEACYNCERYVKKNSKITRCEVDNEARGRNCPCAYPDKFKQIPYARN